MHKGTTHAGASPCLPLRRWLSVLDALWQDVIGAWRCAIARRAEHLDDAALRDLGLSRSELRSVHAEMAGLAEPTRRRVVERRSAPL
jgi:uncharacterized protein YjiS (DUF1127 family)